jgi:hypothetical protein
MGIPDLDRAVLLVEHRGVDALLHDRSHLLRGRPKVAEEHRRPVLRVSERVGREVEVHPSGERVRDHQHRGGEVVRAHEVLDPCFEIPVPAEDRRHEEVPGLDLRGDRSG